MHIVSAVRGSLGIGLWNLISGIDQMAFCRREILRAVTVGVGNRRVGVAGPRPADGSTCQYFSGKFL